MNPTAKARILLVEDEPQMLDICRYILTNAGYAVVAVRDAESAWKQVPDQHFDLALCDIMLPGASGLTLARRLRETTEIPICFLSAKGTPEERIAGFEAGGEDYIVKPFNARELLMRVAVILRRGSQELIRNGPLVMGRDSNVIAVDGRRVVVSELEGRLLRKLVEHRGESVPWRELVSAVWVTQTPETGRDMLKTTISRLRVKLGETKPPLIVAVRGEGYLMPDLTRGEHES